MKEQKNWPFEPLGNPWVDPCSGGPGGGPGVPD